MRGRLASRAHSFKENFLNVFGASHNSSSHPQLQQQSQLNHVLEDEVAVAAAAASSPASKDVSSSEKSSIAKKKTNSTDNIIEYVTASASSVADPRSTEAMVREVNVALRYFQVSCPIVSFFTLGDNNLLINLGRCGKRDV